MLYSGCVLPAARRTGLLRGIRDGRTTILPPGLAGGGGGERGRTENGVSRGVVDMQTRAS